MEIVKGELQPNTWSAFWQTAVRQERVGGRQKLVTAAGTPRKSRVLAHPRDEVR